MEFWARQFDKLLLAALLLANGYLIFHFVHHPETKEYLAWGVRTGDILLGALVGLITGRAIARKEENRVNASESKESKGNGNQRSTR